MVALYTFSMPADGAIILFAASLDCRPSVQVSRTEYWRSRQNASPKQMSPKRPAAKGLKPENGLDPSRARRAILPLLLEFISFFTLQPHTLTQLTGLTGYETISSRGCAAGRDRHSRAQSHTRFRA